MQLKLKIKIFFSNSTNVLMLYSDVPYLDDYQGISRIGNTPVQL